MFGQKELWDGVVLDLNNDIFGPENVILRTLLFFGERVVPCPPRRNSLSRMIHERIQGRGPRPDSENLGWRTEGVRGYADFMEIAEFQWNLEELIGLAKDTLVVIMCAEAAYLRCHRQLIADALLAQGLRVEHIVRLARRIPHKLTAWARVEGTKVDYPAVSV